MIVGAVSFCLFEILRFVAIALIYTPVFLSPRPAGVTECACFLMLGSFALVCAAND
jgi:hypothetical protein